MTVTRSVTPIAVAVVALLLAACQHAPPASSSTPVRPQAETTIRWNTPGEASPSSAPSVSSSASAPSSSASPGLPPGSTIQWTDPATPAPKTSPSAASDSPAGLPPGSTIQWRDQAAPAPSASAPPPAPAQPGPDLRWRSGIAGDTMTIEIIDRFGYYRVDRVALVSPEGQEFPAREVTYFAPTYDSARGSSSVGVGVGSWGGSHSGTGVGVGLGFPLGGSSPSSSDPDRNAPRTVARVQVPDLEHYRRTAANWTVRVRLLDSAGGASVARFPAPLPPRS